MKTKQYELIICSVNPEYAEKVIKTAKELGVQNATSIKGRATGTYETESFMGIQIQPEKEIIFLVVQKQHRRKVMKFIAEEAGVYTESRGLVFSLPIEDWTGTLSKIAIPNPAPELQVEEISITTPQDSNPNADTATSDLSIANTQSDKTAQSIKSQNEKNTEN